MDAKATSTPIRVPVARYELEDGPRLLVAVGRRDCDGRVALDQLVDRPERRPGRAYVVESELSPGDGLAALVADYTRQATELGACPMSAAGLQSMLRFGSFAEAGALS